MASKRVLAERISYEAKLRKAERAAIEHERELRVVADRHEYRMRRQVEKSKALALKLQFSETGRRLSELNNNHERIDRVLATTVSRETFDGYVKATEAGVKLAVGNVEAAAAVRQTDNDRRITAVERAGIRLGGAGDFGRWLVPVLLSLLTAAVLYLAARGGAVLPGVTP